TGRTGSSPGPAGIPMTWALPPRSWWWRCWSRPGSRSSWRSMTLCSGGGGRRSLSPASAEVSLTSSTGVLTCPDEGSSVVISCLVHDVVQGGDDARASGGGPWFGDAIVDGSGGRRRAGRPGGPVPGLSHRYRPVAEHGQGLCPRSQGLLVLHRFPGPGLARGPAG